MSSSIKAKLLLILFRIGLVKSVLVTSYHFFLPIQFNWSKGLQQTPEILSWSLHTLNFDWSLMGLIFSLILLYFSFSKDQETHSKKVITIGFFSYWVVHTAYLMLNSAPLPSQLQWISYLFLGFALMTTTLIGCGILVFSPPKKHEVAIALT